MLKTELTEIANIPYRNRKREENAINYSESVEEKEKFKSNLISIIAGVLIGLLFGLCHCISVSASDIKSFSSQEWVDICYIARVVEAEAGNQSDKGKRLVADTVLNRLNNGSFGEDVKSIIEQENQYADGITASEDTIRIVMEEYRNQTNTEVLYFRTSHYHKFATDMFVVGDHYFSK